PHCDGRLVPQHLKVVIAGGHELGIVRDTPEFGVAVESRASEIRRCHGSTPTPKDEHFGMEALQATDFSARFDERPQRSNVASSRSKIREAEARHDLQVAEPYAGEEPFDHPLLDEGAC